MMIDDGGCVELKAPPSKRPDKGSRRLPPDQPRVGSAEWIDADEPISEEPSLNYQAVMVA